MTLTDAIGKIGYGNCLLFVGSGFSCNASKADGQPLLTAGELTKALYEACGIAENDYMLDKASQIYLEEKGEYQLVEFLKEQFTAYDILPEQKFIGSLPWRRIYTTNYDNVVEKAYEHHRRRLTKVTLAHHLIAYKDKDKLCIHLNGDIEELTPDKLFNEFKLTQVSYLSKEFIDNEWVNFFRSDLKTSDAVFFIGYSMQFDLDLQKVVYEDPELREKCFFIVREGVGQLSLRNIKLFGQAYPIGLKGFVDEVRKQPLKKPAETYVPAFNCFRRCVLHTTPEPIRDHDIFRLFINGETDITKIFYSLTLPTDYKYYLHRSKIDTITASIEAGDRRLLITSDLGNGKTMLLKGLMALLTHKGYEVYEYIKDEVTLSREVEAICARESNKVVIVVDNYSHKRELMAEIERFQTDQTIIVTERSLTNDVSYAWLSQKLGDFQLINIDRLSETEITALISLFDLYGLWGPFSNLTDYAKYDLVRNTCTANFRYLLLKILESPVVISKFQTVIDEIKTQKGFYDALLLMLLSPIFNLDLELEQVAYILNKRQINNVSFRNNPAIREFVDFDQNAIRLRSSILAEALLKQIADKGVIVSLLSKVCTAIDTYTATPAYKNIIKSLYSYSSVRQALGDDKRDYSAYINQYFESIKELNFSRRNPHFWLQYAIAKMEQGDYAMAKRYFDNAYAFAKSRHDFDTYQIDNHYARYLLQNAIAQGDASQAMAPFMEAHTKLIDPVHKRVVRFYPYRVAENYADFYNTFFSRLTQKDKHAFIHACKEMTDRAAWYLQVEDVGFSKKPMVTSVKQQLEQIVSENAQWL